MELLIIFIAIIFIAILFQYLNKHKPSYEIKKSVSFKIPDNTQITRAT